MAKSIKEIGKKAEDLIEQGNEAKQNVSNCQSRVASANASVASARRQLAAASRTDENGNPVGDVAAAQARLSMAQNQLAASQRALDNAKNEVERINRQKQSQVSEISRHNETSKHNLEKLRRLRSLSFGENANALEEGIASRINEAEDSRVRLLESMGIEANADYVDAEDTSSGSQFQGVNVRSVDVSGDLQSHQGGGGGASEGISSGGRVATPVGGGLGSVGDPFGNPNGGTAVNNAASVANMPNGENAPESAEGQMRGLESAISASFTDGGETAPSSPGKMRSPKESYEDLKKAIRESWMNNFNADEAKKGLSEKAYKDKLDLYRKGVGIAIGEEAAASLTDEDLEQLSRVQNRAFREGLNLTNDELAELYNNATSHNGNFVTENIETKMDLTCQSKALSLLTDEKYSLATWKNLSESERKAALESMVAEMNSILGTNVSTKIVFKDLGLSTRGMYSSADNKVYINSSLLVPRVDNEGNRYDPSYELRKTIIHEMRHAYQHKAVREKMNVLVSDKTIGKWEHNFVPGNYIRVQDGYTFEEYCLQPIEWDAKNFAGQQAELNDAIYMGFRPDHIGSWKFGKLLS